MSKVIDFQELRIAKAKKELQEEIDITLAWIKEMDKKLGREGK